MFHALIRRIIFFKKTNKLKIFIHNFNILPATVIRLAFCTMGTGSFPGVRCGRGVTLTPHPLPVPRSKIEYSYTSTLPKGLRGLLKGETCLL